MGGNPDRIDGWKAIGQHFGRDRTTVIRWARERGLPVHRIPGGTSGSVYALRSELEAWSRGGDAGEGEVPVVEPVAEPEPPGNIQPPAPSRRRWPWLAAGAIVATGIGLAAFGLRASDSPMALPADAEAARLYVDARDAWASRDPEAVAGAIRQLEAVIRAEPGFAPAHAALADAHLLAREFGSEPDALAFPRAKKAAEQALALDPDLAAAHRALGFIAYWWERDPQAAGRAFRRALELNPDEAQTRFWYGNVLADNGEPAAARRELDAARLLDPGSLAIQTDLAWAIWSAGEIVDAERRLRAIVARAPDLVSGHDALSVILLEKGDFAGYLAALSARVQLRGEPRLVRQLAQLEAAARAGGPAAIGPWLVAHARSDEQGKPFPDHSWAAFAASCTNDRAQLGDILAVAVANRERWGSAGFRRAIAQRWRDDAAVQQALKQLTSPRIEPGASAG